MSRYTLISKPDYDGVVTRDGRNIKCYTAQKIEDMFPDGNYVVIGDIQNINQKETSDKVGDIELFSRVVNIRPHGKVKGNGFYIQVGKKNEFIFITEKERESKRLIIPVVSAVAVCAVVLLVLFETGLFSKDEPSIKQIPTSFTVSGCVTRLGVPAEGADVSVVSNNNVLGTAKTDEEGLFAIDNIPNGYYIIMYEFNGSLLSDMVSVNNKPVATEMDFPKNAVRTELSLANYFVADGLMEEVIAQSEEDKLVILSLDAKAIEEPSAEVAEAITAQTGELELLYFNVDIDKKVSVEGVVEENGALHEAKTVMQFTFPFNSLNNVDTRLFRYHNGEVQSFEKIDGPAKERKDGTFFVDNKYITFYSSNFSTFALGYANSRDENEERGSIPLQYSAAGKISYSTGKLSLSYMNPYDSECTMNVYLVFLDGEGKDIVATDTYSLSPGNELVSMDIYPNVLKRISVGERYKGYLVVSFDSDTGSLLSTNPKLELTLVVDE